MDIDRIINNDLPLAGFIRPVPKYKRKVIKTPNRGTHNGYVIYDPSYLPMTTEEIDRLVDIHGGITFDGIYKELEQYNDIEEVIFPFKKSFKFTPNMKVLGFDTAHINDTVEEWNKERVIHEVWRFTQQIACLMENVIKKNVERQILWKSALAHNKSIEAMQLTASALLNSLEPLKKSLPEILIDTRNNNIYVGQYFNIIYNNQIGLHCKLIYSKDDTNIKTVRTIYKKIHDTESLEEYTRITKTYYEDIKDLLDIDSYYSRLDIPTFRKIINDIIAEYDKEHKTKNK